MLTASPAVVLAGINRHIVVTLHHLSSRVEWLLFIAESSGRYSTEAGRVTSEARELYFISTTEVGYMNTD